MVIPHYQDIVDLLRKGLTIEAREKILELREAALRLQEENLALKAESANSRARRSYATRCFTRRAFTGSAPQPKMAPTSRDLTARFAMTGTRSR